MYYIPFLEAYQQALGSNEYYEQVLRVITMLDEPEIRAKRLDGQKWYEIDDIQDLDIAESMFADERVKLLSGRYGGFWRYPQMIDFCYLVNPYFPPQRLIDEMQASFGKLLTQYPSGMRVNSLLAAKNFGVHIENILVGNGASELIKELLGELSGKLGIVKPSFEEYAHRYNEKDIVEFWPDNEDFSYNTDDLIEFFADKDIQNLLIINPDNPSGNYICRSELLKLIKWTGDRNIKLVVDESFVDFSDEDSATIICQDILDANRNLYVMKSISKSYGVPGLRLGVLATGDEDMVGKLKKKVSIWNINSFAEFYMQIEEKYKRDYELAITKFREERARYIGKLSAIKGIRVIPTQANYVMVEVTSGMTAEELNRKLLSNYNLLVKNLESKIDRENRQYLRLAIKSDWENDRLIAALEEILQG
jgi:histidinol-phosphate/aromatic aminotransferase/cobyric acid decarboxylase-like protein